MNQITSTKTMRSPPRDVAAPAGPPFDASFVSELPGDAVLTNVPRQVSDAAYTRVDPSPVRAPRLIGWSDAVAGLLGLDPRASRRTRLRKFRRQSRVARHAAVRRALRRAPVRQLGRAAGRRPRDHARRGRRRTSGERYDIQLKGAGPNAVFAHRRRPRGAALVGARVHVQRSDALSRRADDARAEPRRDRRNRHPRHVLRRQSGARARRDRVPRRAVVHPLRQFRDLRRATTRSRRCKKLADYVIRDHYPELGAPSPAIYAHGSTRSAAARPCWSAHWMRVGFVHGVMNTDNMSILGLTIDYGPYGWLEDYDPEWTPNTTDAAGPPLPLRQPAAHRAVEPGAARQRAAPARRTTRRRSSRRSPRTARRT